jgi:CHAT domain-containing protein
MEAVKIMREVGDQRRFGRALLDLGTNLKDLLLLYEALRAFELAEQSFEATFDTGGRIAALFHRATICRRLRLNHEALELIGLAIDLFSQLVDSRASEGWRGQLRLEYIQNCLDLDRREKAYTAIEEWLNYEAQNAKDSSTEFSSIPYAFRAELHERDEQLDAALEDYCRAVIAASREVLTNRTNRFRTSERANLDFVFGNSLRCAIRTDHASMALGLFELSQTGTIHLPSEHSENSKQDESGSEIETELKAKVMKLAQESTHAIIHRDLQLDRIHGKAEWLLAQRDFFRGKPIFPQEVEGIAKLGEEIRAVLPSSTLLLEFAWVRETLWLFAVSSDSFHIYQIHLDEFALGMLTSSYENECRGLISTDSLSALSDALLSPVASLLREHSAIIVVPSPGLHGVPFHALPYGGAPLIESHRLRYAASGLAVARANRKRPSRLSRSSRCVVLGAPSVQYVDVPELLGVEAEAAQVTRQFEIADFIIQPGATSAEMSRAGAKADVLHFACHGHHEDGLPLLSRLLLRDRPVFSFEIMLANFDVELVVLSACRTAESNIYAGGHQQSIATAFLTAGARNVVAALWPVDDEASSLFVGRFYQEVLRADCQSPAEALRAAQRYLSQQERFSHPYFWAPFAAYSQSNVEE